MEKPNAQLLKKFFENTCTPDEAKEVLDWLSLHEGQNLFDKQFDQEIDAFQKNQDKDSAIPIRSDYVLQNILASINSRNSLEHSKKPKSIGYVWTRIAAVLLGLMLLTNVIVWYLYIRKDQHLVWKEVYVPRGEKMQVLFQEGTRVWLNSDSKLKYPQDFKGDIREVYLDGEAYFVVTKNTSHPFVVNTKKIKIRVTGTSFNVNAYHDGNSYSTVLDEGKISIQKVAVKDSLPIILKPGEKAQLNINTNELVVASSAHGAGSSWKSNQLVFKDTPLPEVKKILERWFNVRIILANKEIENYSYTARFNNEPLATVLAGLEKITPVRCESKDGVVEIRKK